MDSALFHLIEEFIIKECDSRDIEYTPTASRAMRRNLNKVLAQLRESEYEKNTDEILNTESDADKDVKKRKRSDTNLTDSDNETETKSENESEPEREHVDRDYDDSEHKYNYNESIILPINIKYCLGITYICIIFSVYSSMFYIVTKYSCDLNNLYNVEKIDYINNVDNMTFVNYSKSCL